LFSLMRVVFGYCFVVGDAIFFLHLLFFVGGGGGGGRQPPLLLAHNIHGRFEHPYEKGPR